MAKNESHYSHRQQLAKAIPRLGCDLHSFQQNDRVQRQHSYAAQKPSLLRDDGEDEVVVGHAPREVSQPGLRPLSPPLSSQPARANRNLSLPDVVSPLSLQLTGSLALHRGGVWWSEILVKINQQPLALIFLEGDTPVRGKIQRVDDDKQNHHRGSAQKFPEKTKRHTRNKHHRGADREKDQRRPQIRFL